MYGLLVMALVLLVFGPSQAVARQQEFLVTKIIDGNTIQLENGQVVRYMGIDAPHIKKNEGGPQFYSREAARFNKSLVLLKKVRIDLDGSRKDPQGRLLADVYVKKLFVNAEMVRLGYAKADVGTPGARHKDLLLGYEKAASERYAGLWQEEKKDTYPYYIGNKHTYVFHKPSCPLANRVSEKNRIIFRSRMDAISIGYVPDPKCRP